MRRGVRNTPGEGCAMGAQQILGELSSGCITPAGPYGCRQLAAHGPALENVGLTS